MTNRNFKINIHGDVFIVGGAVRDTLLGLPVKDIDRVVVGVTPAEMLNNGFTQVGADFPVFLDINGDEWALARTERKVGKGYHGFEAAFDPTITLEDDLFRRDLTINAMAVNENDWDEFRKTKSTDLIVDPFDGIHDLNDRILEHVSKHFADDPVRILRIARFRARFWAKFRFNISTKTQALINDMVNDGEVDHLVPERVWAETEKALMEDSPDMFFNTLGDTVLLKVMPPFTFFANGTPNVFNKAVNRNLGLSERLMLLTFNMHEAAIKTFIDFKVPNKLINDCMFFRSVFFNFNGLINDKVSAATMLRLLTVFDAWKQPERLRSLGVPLSMFGSENIDKNFDKLINGLQFANTANFNMLSDKQKGTLKGKEISDAIMQLRLTMLEKS